MRHGVAKRKLCEQSRDAGASFTQVWTADRESATRTLVEAGRKRLKGAMTNFASAQLTWDADLLLRFDFERMQVVHDLLSRVPGFPRQIVDLGCGPGTSTRMLVDRFPGAEITGVDISQSMLAVAAERAPGASFVCADIAAWRPEAPVDLVFADSALQWIGEHEQLFGKLMGWLAPGGTLAVQMPDNRQEPSHALMRLIAADGPWASRLVPIAKTRAVIGAYGDYYRWLRPLSASLDIWLTEYIHPLDGVEAIVDWFRGSALRPFLAPLSDSERETFLGRYRRDLAESYQEEEDGKVLFIYPRLFMLARKAE
jgi:trans-aconitate 2-methyltransferase